MKITLPILVFLNTILFSWVFGAGLFAQNNVEYLTIEDGLSQGFISKIIQDKEGFIWFGTRNGLNRYDGYQFEVFTHNPLDSLSIQGNVIRGIIELDDYLLVGTSGSGLNVFNKKTKRFFPLLAEGVLKDSIESGRMPSFILDKNGFLWTQLNFPREKSRLAKLKIELFEQKPAIIKEGEFWDIPNISNIYYDTERAFITGISNNVRLFQIDVNSGKIEYFDFPPNYVQKDFHLRFSKGWFYHQSGFGRLEKEGWRWHETDFEINKVLFDAEKKLINISVLPGELLQYEIPPINTKKLYQKDGLSIFKIKHRGINSLFTDKSKVLWIGTTGYGIGKLKPNLRPFNTLVEDLSIKQPIFIDNEGRFSFYANFQWIDSPSGHSLENFPTRKNHRVFFKQDSKHTEWASVQLEKEVRVYQKKPPKSAFELVFSIPHQFSEFKNYHIFNFDNSGNIILAFTDSFLKYDIQTKEIQRFNFRKYLPLSHRINGLVNTPDGTIWIATNKGLIRILSIEQDADIKVFKTEKQHKNSPLSSNISSLLVDPKNENLLWIGTLGGGLSRLNIRTLKFTHFNTRNGFPNDVIYSVLSDKKGHLWLSSNKGIIHFDPETKVIKNYTTKDGLPSNEFNFRAYGQSADGTIFFGGINGVISFHPDEISDNLVTPVVRLPNLEINDQKIVYGDSTGILSQSIEFEKAIELSHFQNDITLEFAGLEYFSPSNNQLQRWWFKIPKFRRLKMRI